MPGGGGGVGDLVDLMHYGLSKFHALSLDKLWTHDSRAQRCPELTRHDALWIHDSRALRCLELTGNKHSGVMRLELCRAMYCLLWTVHALSKDVKSFLDNE